MHRAHSRWRRCCAACLHILCAQGLSRLARSAALKVRQVAAALPDTCASCAQPARRMECCSAHLDAHVAAPRPQLQQTLATHRSFDDWWTDMWPENRWDHCDGRARSGARGAAAALQGACRRRVLCAGPLGARACTQETASLLFNNLSSDSKHLVYAHKHNAWLIKVPASSVGRRSAMPACH